MLKHLVASQNQVKVSVYVLCLVKMDSFTLKHDILFHSFLSSLWFTAELENFLPDSTFVLASLLYLHADNISSKMYGIAWSTPNMSNIVQLLFR